MSLSSLLRSFGFILAPLLFLSCGKSDEYTVSLSTGLENLRPARNLMAGLSHLKLAVGTDSCRQPDLFAGFRPGVVPNSEDPSAIINRPLEMLTSWTGVPNPMTASWIGLNSQFPPIEFKVPAGPNKFAVIGSIISPSASLVDGIGNCKKLTAAGVPVGTLSVSGRVGMDVNSNMTIPVKVWMVPSYASPSPNPDALCFDQAKENEDRASQECPMRNFSRLVCAGFNTSMCHGQFRLDYFYGAQNQHVIQTLDMQGQFTPYTIPDMTPLLITSISGTSMIGNGMLVTKPSMAETGQFTTTYPGGTISVVSASGLGIALNQYNNTANFIAVWNTISGAATYTIAAKTGRLDRSNGTTGFAVCSNNHANNNFDSTATGCSGEFTAGSFSTVVVYPNGNIQGSPYAWFHYKPVASLSASASTPGPVGQVKISVSTSIPAGATHMFLDMSGTTPYKSPLIPVTDGVFDGGTSSYIFLLNNIPSGSYSTHIIRAVNMNGGQSYSTGSVINVP